jgi:uncharacterized membrane protein
VTSDGVSAIIYISTVLSFVLETCASAHEYVIDEVDGLIGVELGAMKNEGWTWMDGWTWMMTVKATLIFVV